MLYSMGFVIATGCLHGIGIAILGLIHRWPQADSPCVAQARSLLSWA